MVDSGHHRLPGDSSQHINGEVKTKWSPVTMACSSRKTKQNKNQGFVFIFAAASPFSPINYELEFCAQEASSLIQQLSLFGR